MAELTAFGKEVRKLRLDKGVSLMDMADALGCSAAFVSSVETGRKDPPEGYVSQTAKFLKLNKESASQLQKLAMETRNIVRLRPTSKNREVVAEFARKFDSLGKREVNEILEILSRVQGK